MQLKNNLIRKILILLFCICLSFEGFATTDLPFVQKLDGRIGQLQGPAYSALTTADLIYENLTTRARIDLTKPQFYSNTISFIFDESNTNIPVSDFSCEITFNVQYNNVAGTTTNLTNQKLKVTYNAGAGIKYDARQYLHFVDGENVTVTVTSINTFGASWDVTTFLILENTIEVTRDYKFNVSSPEQVTTLVNNGTSSTIIDELQVSWNIVPESARTNYDIEWAWIDANIANRYQVSGQFNTDLIFSSNATRITIPDKFGPGENPNYKIPMMYDGAGYLFYRVRPVQYLVSGRIINGGWSSSSTTDYFQFTGHETKLNWQSNTSYAEDGKRKTVIQYFDGTMRSRQTVTKDNTSFSTTDHLSNTTIVAETMYDYQGRPAIHVLPAPTLSNIIQYAQNFNRFQTTLNDPYPKDLYDIVQPNQTACNSGTAPLEVVGPANAITGAGQYYSPNNPKINDGENKFIPNAQGFPYTETRYSQDGTGRIIAQGGVGPDHQLGTGKETKYFYGSANQKELDALFGTEVGEASHYFKNMVRDANGQYTVSYVDMNGRTIATALAGKNPDNIVPLESYTQQQTNTLPLTENLITPSNNIISGRDIIASKTLLVPKQGDYIFNYQLNPESAEIIACNPQGQTVCYDCLYDLEIRITDNCGGFSKIFTRKNFTFGSPPDPNCSTPAPSITVLNELVPLPEGEYNVVKKLSLSSAGQRAYKNGLFKSKNLCKTLQQFLTEILQQVNSESNCMPTCSQCTTALGTLQDYKAMYLAALGTTSLTPQQEQEATTSYIENLQHCNDLCSTNPGNALEGIRLQMLADVTPASGQYALKDDANKMYSIYKYVPSLLRKPFLFPVNNYPLFDPSSQLDFYRDETGNIDHDGNDDNHTYTFASAEEFEEVAKDSWVNSLLPYHPEYHKYYVAKTDLLQSYEFDAALNNTDTYADAASSAKDYINNIIYHDPFFSGPGLAYQNQMTQLMNVDYIHNAQGTYSMWQVAYMTTNCFTFGSQMDQTCADNSPKFPPFNLNSCNGDWNKIWTTFRSLYLTAKNDMVEDYLNNLCPETANFYGSLPFTHYQRVFGTVAEMGLGADPQTGGFPPDVNTVNTNTTDFYETNCESYRQMWIDDIMQCDQVINMSENDRNNLLTQLTDALKDVCIRGSDANHIFGSASEIPNDPRVFDNFTDAVSSIFGSYGISTTALCHPYLITYPNRYETTPPLSDYNVVLTQDPCVCNRLTEVSQQQLNEGFPGTLSEYLQYHYGITISQNTINTLIGGCSGNGCVTYEEPVTVSGFFSCNGSQTETCIDCDQYNFHKTKFYNEFPGLTNAPYQNPNGQNEIDENAVFEHYMNNATGFHKNVSEYMLFEKACSTYTSHIKCEDLEPIVALFHQAYPNLSGEDCRNQFVIFFNQQMGSFYTWPDIVQLFLQGCGHPPDVCVRQIRCFAFTNIINSFLVYYNALDPKPDCQEAFVAYFNAQMETNYTWEELVTLHHQVCPGELNVCDPCAHLNEIINAFRETDPWLSSSFDCIDLFTTFYNNYMGTNLTIAEVQAILSSCIDRVNICGPSINCPTLQTYVNAYLTHGGTDNCTSVFAPGTPEYCRDCFTQYINALLHKQYTYPQIQQLYELVCGVPLDVCAGTFDCNILSVFVVDYLQGHANPGDCWTVFTNAFNEHFGTTYTVEQIKALYLLYCGYPPAICGNHHRPSGQELKELTDAFEKLYPNPAGYFNGGCAEAFAAYYNSAIGDTLTVAQVQARYFEITGQTLNICTPGNCSTLQSIYTQYLQQFGSYNFPQLLRKDLLIRMYVDIVQPGAVPTWNELKNIFLSCNINPNMPADNGTLFTCNKIMGVKDAYFLLHPGAIEKGCEEQFAAFFNLYYNVNMTHAAIVLWARTNCNVSLDMCGAGEIAVAVDAVAELRDPAVVAGVGSISINLLPPRLCGLNTPQSPTIEEPPVDPCDYNNTLSLNAAIEQYNLYVQHQLDNFDIAYQNKCMQAKNIEQFTVSYTPAEYHYTLYYYDRAGNVVKTVPPAGVHPNFDNAYLSSIDAWRNNELLPRPVDPMHTLSKEMRYNTLGQVTMQKTPDAGKTEFWYDRLGRLVLSQNAKQAHDNKFSFTVYDILGRVEEVGEKIINSSVTQALTQDATNFASALAGQRTQVTHTVYDLVYEPWCDPNSSNNILCQKNLRNRVSYTYVIDDNQNSAKPWDAATFYSYDLHGNADIVLQDYYTGIMRTTNNRWKKIEYKYDLVSGKINEVAYQAGKADAFYHRYGYDAENRLTEIKTSRDKVYWESDARYKYYKFGPLSRLELGENRVQGADYAYTLHGWLKGVNSSAVGDGNFDMGGDGKISGFNSLVARDVYGFNLNYYTNDYVPINTTTIPFAGGMHNLLNTDATPLTVAKPLFNGNIASMFVNIPKIGNAQLYGYQYDQLNRIKSMDVFRGYNNSLNTLTSPIATDDYKERINYDPNGNILSYTRNGTQAVNGTAMDQLSYTYDYFDAGGNRHTYVPGQTILPSGAKPTNRLNNVTDGAGGSYTEDIKTQNPNNYDYDDIGNLTADVKEGITNVTWNVYGKVENATKGGVVITYRYDAAGNRISKLYNGTETIYVHDASGNPMCVYENGGLSNNGHLTQSELYIYGSGKIGVQYSGTDMTILPPALQPIAITRVEKNYELTNHLGNLMAIVSDKHIPHNSGNGTVDFYDADVISANDYYPGGMLLAGRKFQLSSANKYRYGFNSHEKSNELGDDGNHTTAVFGEYDTRLMRRWNPDPKPASSTSPYSMFNNNPIWFDDMALDTPRNAGNGQLGQQFNFVNDGSLTPAQFQQMQTAFLNNLNQQMNNSGRTYQGQPISLNTNDPLASVIQVTFGVSNPDNSGTSSSSMENSSMFIQQNELLQPSSNVATHEWLHTAGLMDRYYELYGRAESDKDDQTVDRQRSGAVPMGILPPGHDNNHNVSNMMATSGAQITPMQWNIVFNLGTGGGSEASLGTLGKVSFVYSYRFSTNPTTDARLKQNAGNALVGVISARTNSIAFSSRTAFSMKGTTLLAIPNQSLDAMPAGLNTYIIHNRSGNILGNNLSILEPWEINQINSSIRR